MKSVSGVIISEYLSSHYGDNITFPKSSDGTEEIRPDIRFTYWDGEVGH